MSHLLPLAFLILGLALAAYTGPTLLRRAAPALARYPRLAVALLLASSFLWVLALLALGPLLAWYLSGPTLLPDQAAEICRRCIEASGPFPDSTVTTVLPVLPLLLLPAAGAVFLTTRAAAHARARGRVSRAAAVKLTSTGVIQQVAGYRVTLIDDRSPVACSLPRHLGGIVLSRGTLRVLTEEELAAVTAHEHAHLRQRHHLIALVTQCLSRSLRHVPLIATACDAVPHYLEIAADDAARRHAGTRALAAALLKLGEPLDVATPGRAPRPPGLLHAAGPERIRHLVAPPSPHCGAGAALTAIAQVALLAVLGASVHAAYATAVLTGCA